MTVVYSKTYTSDSTGLHYRTKCDYTVTSNNTSVTVSGTIQLQYYGTYNASYVALGANGEIANGPGYAVESFATDSMSPDVSKSTWTNVGNSKSFTFSNPKNESAYTKTYYVSCGNIYFTPENYNTFSVSVPALASYNVTYNANGGSGAPATQKKYYGKTLTLSSVKPTKTNYSFWHWNTNASNSGTTYNSGASYTSNAGATLYAIWNPIIYYNGNGVSLSGFPNQVKTYNASTNVYSSTPKRDGYRFVEWNTSADGSGTSYMPSGGISSGMNTTMTLYAIWQTMPANPKITSMTAIRCDQNGVEDDEGGYCSVTVEWEIDATSEAYPSNSGTVTGTIKEEGEEEETYTFSGDHTGTGGTATALISGIDTDHQYIVSATVTDQQPVSTTKNVILTRAFYIMDFKAGGVGLGIGRAAPDNGLQVGYETTFDEDVSMVKDLSVDGDETVNGTVTVGGGIEADGAVTAGGDIIHKSSWDGSSIPSSTTGNIVKDYKIVDSSSGNRWIGHVESVVYSSDSPNRSGYVALLLAARHPTNGTANTLGIYVKSDGTIDYTVTDQAKFRSAISAQESMSVSSSINIASYITSSTGTFVSGTVRTYGKICMLRIVFKNASTIGKNGVVYAGTISSYKPVQQVIGVGSNGGNAVSCSIDGSGNISARNCGASASFTDTAIAVTYIIP